MIDPLKIQMGIELATYKRMGSIDELKFTMNLLESLIALLEEKEMEDLILEATGKVVGIEDDKGDIQEDDETPITECDCEDCASIHDEATWKVIAIQKEQDLFEQILLEGGISDMFILGEK